MRFRRLGDDAGTCSSYEAAVRENSVSAQNDFVDAGHESEDCAVGDQNDGDASLSEGFPKRICAQGVFVAVCELACDCSVRGGVVVWM